jgi:hypothetical protein
MLKTLAAATLALAALAGPAAAQDAEGIVDAQLNLVTAESGFTAGPRVTGRLAADRSELARLAAPAGDIHFIGVCDRGCSDLDLIVRDSTGREVGRDLEPDDVPIVTVEGAAAGRYTVEVSMVACTGECDWGVGVFR